MFCSGCFVGILNVNVSPQHLISGHTKMISVNPVLMDQKLKLDQKHMWETYPDPLSISAFSKKRRSGRERRQSGIDLWIIRFKCSPPQQIQINRETTNTDSASLSPEENVLIIQFCRNPDYINSNVSTHTAKTQLFCSISTLQQCKG